LQLKVILPSQVKKEAGLINLTQRDSDKKARLLTRTLD
jgi:hypothetical protein